MGLPDRNTATTWGGKLLVDRDGTEIGTCTQVFVDDATGLPEWASADLNGGPAVVPLLDAAEAGDNVRVAVRQAEVTEAPRVADPGHISEDEEERLYRHYGIQFSREASDSLLPVDGPVTPDVVAPAPNATSPSSSTSETPVSISDVNESSDVVVDTTGTKRGGLVRSLAAATAGVLAVVVAAVLWRRRRRAVPLTRKELLAARARAASLALATRKEQVSTSTAPLLQSGRQRSAATAQKASVQSRVAARRASEQGRVVAERASEQARVAAERAAVQARAAAQQAAALAAIARTLRIQRVPSDADVAAQAVAPVATAAGQRKAKVLGVLETVGGFAAGYTVRARSGGPRHEQTGQTEQPSDGQGRQFKQVAGRVQGQVTSTLQAGSAQLSQRAGAVAGKVRRRSDADSDASVGSGEFGPA